MLNPTFPKAMQQSIEHTYVAPKHLADHISAGNGVYDTGGTEHRLQEIYGQEIWLKLARISMLPDHFNRAEVLEVCAGTGFFTHHLLQRCRPQHLTVNDMSSTELDLAQNLVKEKHPDINIDWMIGDLHKIDFGRRFDIIIGNSFMHHFYDVPTMMVRFLSMLKPGGVFISLHEPTLMSTVVEAGKLSAWPLAVVAPTLVNNIARIRHKGPPSATDLWMFDAKTIKGVAHAAGFSHVEMTPWSLVRAIAVHRNELHLSEKKPMLSVVEEKILRQSISVDAFLNRVLPTRCFGSLCIACFR